VVTEGLTYGFKDRRNIGLPVGFVRFGSSAPLAFALTACSDDDGESRRLERALVNRASAVSYCNGDCRTFYAKSAECRDPRRIGGRIFYRCRIGYGGIHVLPRRSARHSAPRIPAIP
jgi:hypothetical protein